jgi:hypothetical protein
MEKRTPHCHNIVSNTAKAKEEEEKQKGKNSS